MTLTAEFRLDSYQLPLVDVAAAVPDLTLQLVHSEQPETGPFVFFIRASGSSFDGLEPALDHSPWIGDRVRITETESMRVYQLVTTSRRPTAIERLRLGETYTESVTFLPNGWRMCQQFADRDAFTTFRDSCSEMDLSFHLDRLYDVDVTDIELMGLTDKQHEALLTAYEMGYFTVPRQASMADVATALELSVPAFAERVHRAEVHLIEHFFYSALYNTPDSLESS